jgi:trimeric autotransporter adhesin
MKKVLHRMHSWVVCSSLIVLSLTAFVSTSFGQVDVTASGGTAAGTYTTLKDAFDAINAGTHQGTISLGISGNTTETASAVLMGSGTGSASYTSVTISPTGGASRTISGSLAGPLIDLNGADNVTFNGLNTGGNSLVLSNASTASTAGTSTVRFINDATGNAVTNCTVLGASTGAASQNGGTASAVTATILFGGSTGTTGNDNNTISNSSIGDAAALPTVAIGSAGQSATITNDNVTVSGNSIFNFYGASGANGIDLASNSSAWTITGNRFFQTASRTGLSSAAYLENIYVNSAGGGFVINNNVIGYASAAGTGMYTVNGGRFVGIDIAAAAATPVSSIQGNTINGINWTTASGASTGGAAVFNAIVVKGGSVNIGTTTGNTIGNAAATGSATSNIYLVSTTNGSGIVGIYAATTGTTAISSNTIGGIATSGAAGIGFAFTGIQTSGTGTSSVMGNSIGGSVTESISLGILGTTTASCTVYGIYNNAAGTFAIGASGTGNQVRNITVNSSGSNTFAGIYNSSSVIGTNSIAYNTIDNILFTAASTSTTYYGIYNSAAASTSTLSITNNTLGANAASFTGATGGTGSFNAIYQSGAPLVETISSNTISGLSVKTTGTIYLIYNNFSGPANGTKTIQNNTVNGFTRSVATASSSFYGYYDNASSPTSVTHVISGNTFNNLTNNATGSSTMTVIYSLDYSSSNPALSVFNNSVTNITHSGTGTFTGITVSGFGGTAGTPNEVYGNTVSGINISSTSTSHVGLSVGSVALYVNVHDNVVQNGTFTGAASQFVGISAGGTSNLNKFYNNTVTNLNSSVSAALIGIIVSGGSQMDIYENTVNSISSAGNVWGLYVNGGTLINVYNHEVLGAANKSIYGLTSSGATTLAEGIRVAGGTTVNVYRNGIYGISNSSSSTTAAASLVNGLGITAGTTVNAYNNVIGQLTAPAVSYTDAIRGISVTSTSTSSNYRIYNNTVYLNASSTGANFGTSGIFHTGSTTASTAALDLRNNILINESTPAGTGLTVVFRRGTAASTNLASASNRNLLYAGTPSATRLIYTDGTAQQTLLNYVQNVLPAGHDVNSFTGEGFAYATPGSFFTSLTGSSADFLRPVTGVTTQGESGASVITTPAITTDFTGAIRGGNAGYTGTGTAPDVGAYEFNGTTPAPIITFNSITPGTTPQCVAAARVVSVNVTTLSGTITSVNLAYTVNGTPQAPIAMTNTSGSTWTATIPVPTPANATVAWAVAAQNSLGFSSSYTGTPYADEPLTGVVATASNSASTVCAGSPSSLSVSLARSGSVAVGTGISGNPSNTAVGAFYGTWFGNGHAQILFTASELTAAGLAAGNITSLAVNVSATGSPATLNGFTIKMAPTSATSITTFQSPSFVTVVPAANYTPVVGVNTHTFTTPFNWDGTSNIIIDYCFANGVTGSTSAVNTVTTTAFGSFVNYNADGSSGAGACTSTSVTNASTSRPNIIFTGNYPPAIQSVTWMNGAATVGTGNPLAVSPTSTTTYTATITSAGCTLGSSPTTTVTVNPLPSAPTGTNSAQCGVQIPTASVASTSGLPTPTFKWYTAATGGTVAQTSTSTTFTTTVSTTTTYYVSELNTVTGCESPRTAVTINVSSPDPVSLTASSAAICIGQPVTLTAANTSATPFQSYTYSTVSTTGSGASTAIAGSPFTVTPTAAGSYTYTLTATDGGCAASATATVTVNALPVISTATATPAAVCSGSPITLTGASVIASAGTAAVGTQTTTEQGGGVYRTGYGTGDFRHQLLFTAAELNAAGVQAGNITAISFNVTTVGTGTMNNYTIKMGAASAAVMTATFLTNPTSTVYTAATYTAVSGVNTHTFGTPYNWDGTSNVLIDICYNVSVIGGSSTLAANTPSSVRNTNLLGTTGACTAASGGTYANRPLVTFAGQIGTNQASSLNWVWTPGTGLNTAVATTSITNLSASPVTQAFTVTATNPSTGCSATATTAPVTINPVTAAPTANNSTQCGPGNVTASVTGSGISGNTFAWYTVATGGTAIAGQTGSSLSSYPVTATTTFYVAEVFGSCQSARTAVTVTVTTPPAITVSGTNTVCNGTATTLTVSSPNDPNYTYTWSNGLGTGATVSASPSVNTTYTVTAVDMTGGANNGCNTTATYAVTVTPVPTAVAASATDNSICSGEAVTLSSTANTNSAPVSVPLLSQNFDSGIGSWTTVNGGSSPAVSNWNIHAPSYTSSNFGANFTNFNTPQGGQFAISNSADGGNGSTTNTKLVSPSFSTTGMTSATLTFQNLYKKWASGDATVAVEISTDNGTTWSVLKDYITPGTQGTTTDNAQVPANESITLGAAYLNQANVRIRFNYVSAWGYYWIIDNVAITGQQPGASSYAWTSSPAGFTSSAQNPAATVAPTATTTYTVTVSNSYGCSTSASTTVTVNQPTSSTTNQTACSSYTWTNGTNYTTSGTYTQTLTNAAGCDSTATLVLTINQPTSSTTTQTACASYTWTNGTTYTTSGTYTQTLTNAVGCDSVATLVLTINQPTSSTTTQTACSSYTWTNGTTYTTSGTYTQTLLNAAGCDSTATLVLTINQPTTSTTFETACDSLTWTNGITYTASGTYTQTLVNAGGCDSTATLVLTINNSSSSTTTITQCDSYTWTNGTTYTASGTYTQTLSTGSGCDSTATLILTITNASSTTTITECDSFTWTNGVTYTASGTYTQLLSTAGGCDSTATLVLTINSTSPSTTTITACDSYTWTNGVSYTASGTYTQLLTGSTGCDSTATLVLTISATPVATATLSNNTTLTASAGASYQWFNCATGMAIPGATSQTYTATANGSYSVTVSNAAGCSDSSACVTVATVGIKENIEGSIAVFPNPTRSDVTITMSDVSADVQIVDAQGKMLRAVTVSNGEKIDLSDYVPGVYFLRITTETGSALERVVKN